MDNVVVCVKLWIELFLRVLVIWYSETVRLKGTDAYYVNFEMSTNLEYSTCEYYIISVGNARFNIFGLKIAAFDYILYSMSHIRGLKYF